jgi:uncharacterized membrane protein|tara:strand:+ start:36 stop:230 length:195 start_codon:yes stop_codon:yes gene_type:complete
MTDALAGYIGIIFVYLLMFRIIDIKAKREKEKRRNNVANEWHRLKGKERKIDNKHYRKISEESS